MTLRDACKKQLERIPANVAGRPETETDRKSYIDVFTKHARSEGHAQRVIDSLIEKCEFYPRLPELIETCEAIPDEVPSKDCAICNGQPFVPAMLRGHESACRCVCVKGEYLAARDREAGRSALSRDARKAAIREYSAAPNPPPLRLNPNPPVTRRPPARASRTVAAPQNADSRG